MPLYSYPLTMPTTPKPANSEWTLNMVQGVSTSPFTFKEQIVEHQGKRWEWTLQYPKMTQTTAQAWIEFILELHGKVGTFYFADPDGNVRGVPLGSPVVTAFASDKLSVTSSGWTATKTGVLLKGDWISFSNYEYKRVMADVNSDGSGNATIYFEPAMHTTVGAGTTIATTDAKGIFKLADPKTKFTSDFLKHYEMSLIIVEAIT